MGLGRGGVAAGKDLCIGVKHASTTPGGPASAQPSFALKYRLDLTIAADQADAQGLTDGNTGVKVWLAKKEHLQIPTWRGLTRY